MKSYLLLLLFISQIAGAQLKSEPPVIKHVIGEVRLLGEFKAGLYYFVSEGDTVYALMYSNSEYQYISDIQSIRFDNSENTLDHLYELLLSFLTDKDKMGKEYREQIVLGETRILIRAQKMFGNYVTLYPEVGYFSLTKKDLKKLFGKE